MKRLSLARVFLNHHLMNNFSSLKNSFVVSFALFAVASLHAAQPWQEITMPTVAEAAASFSSPPGEYGAIHWATGFPPPKERILSDIEHIDANGGSVYMINSGGRLFRSDEGCR